MNIIFSQPAYQLFLCIQKKKKSSMQIKDTNLEGCHTQNALQGQIQPKLHFFFSLMFLEGVFKLVGGDSMGFDMKM